MKKVRVNDVKEVTELLENREDWGESHLRVGETDVVTALICPFCTSLVVSDEYSVKLHSDVHIATARALEDLRLQYRGR